MLIFSWYYYFLGIILIPGIVMSIIAQSKVSSTFNKYNQVTNDGQYSASKLARHLLDSAGLSDIQVKKCAGKLTDHYNPKEKTVSLSENVHDNTSISALGVMAHELGHVMQYKDNYFYIKIRAFLVPVINFTSFLMWPLIIIGIIVEALSYTQVGKVFIIIGVCIFALSTLICLVTIPLERNASKRAYTLLVKTGFLTEEQGQGVKEVLDAASLTYVAALVTSILALVRLLLFIASIRRD